MVGIPEPAARYIGSGVTDGSPPPLELRFEGCRSCSSGGEEDTPRRDGRLDPGVSSLAGANGATFYRLSLLQLLEPSICYPATDKTICSDTLSSQRHTSDVGAYDGRNPEDFQFKPQLEHLMP
ncbi:hypothetical protein OPV22_033475 [Ensete ventricosum]|uniref:Uncharacterized protein n=1 Tax=Ensete ventricosum TaxID=4639 RepID=A0AAV8PUE3_ENSVE|nr:hypothetical protein OPV22_033475 [Ensete ventricosum]